MRGLLHSTALATILLTASPAFAQETEAAKENAGIADIIVTAQRREENIQKTALSIEVFSGDDLANRGISRPDDLTKIATGVQVGGGTTTQIYIRGVGDFGVLASANPAVVVSLNGVAISRPQAISGNFFDLERVELLKGPQGTLYGRNASGGALNLIAAKPKLGEDSAFVNGSFGNFNAVGIDGAVNIAAGETVALRAAFQLSDRDGYLTDGGDDDKHQSFRLSLLAQPSEDLTLRLTGGYTHLGGNGTGLAVIPPIPGESPFTGTTSPAATAQFLSFVNANLVNSGGMSPPPFLFDLPNPSDLTQNVQSWNIDGQLDYDFGGATLTIIPAFRRTTVKANVAPSFIFSSGGFGTDGDTSNQYSLEARLGGAGPKLKWVVGFFGLQEDQTSDFAVVSGLIQRVRVSSDLGTKAYAGFGELTYSVTDSLRLIAGARYTSDKRSQTDFQNFAISPTTATPPPGADPCMPPFAMPGTLCNLLPAGANFDSSETFNRLTWKAGVEFDLSSDNLLFATVSNGFKAGGFNQSIDPVDPTRAFAFNPEKVTAYTVGLRNRFLDNRLQVNLEGFYWDYKDLQLSTLILDGTGNLSLATQNAGQARLYGFNVDVVAQPEDGLTLSAGIEYVNSRYTEFSFQQFAQFATPGSTGCAVTPTGTNGVLGPLVSINCSGNSLVRSPEWTANASLNKVFELANADSVVFDTDIAIATSRFTSTSFVPNSRVGAYGNWSASLTYNKADGDWYVGGFVRNITNAAVYTGGGGDQNPFVNGFVTSSVGAPRTYGARVGFRF